MRIHTKFDKTRRKVLAKEIDLKRSQFNLSRHAFFRIVVGSSAVLLMAVLAFYFEQYVIMWIAIAWSLGVGLWQTAYYGYTSSQKSAKTLEVTNFYSKGVLIFLAFFWAVRFRRIRLSFDM